MDKTTFRILDTLCRGLGSPISINELKNRVSKIYGSAYYKNIYDKIKTLEEEGILILESIGKSKAISLNFANYRTTSLLGEMEKLKLGKILENARLKQLFEEIENQTRGIFLSISTVKPFENLSMNRAELLILKFQDEELYTTIKKIEGKTNIRIDPLILSKQEFLDLISSSEHNPLKSMLKDQTVIIKPDDFWAVIRESSGIYIEDETQFPISEKDIVYNLNRFGYREIGEKIQEGKKICPELIITGILASGTSRKKEAVPILLSKNKISYPLLIFLAKKYNKLDILLGSLKALNKIKKTEEAENVVQIIEDMGIKEKRIDYKIIKEKMDLYGG